MASEVKIKIKIDDNGSLSVVANEADKASKATDKLGKATDKTNKSRSRYHKQEKGVAGATSNSTKGFAKQVQTIGGGSSGLVGAYATLAAHVFAVSAAFGVLQRNAGFKQLEQGIIFTGRAAGTNLPIVAKNLKEITDSAISTADAMKAVAIGTSAGFSSSQLEGLTKVAKGASLALGRDMTDALDRLVRGAAKLEPEILDELGIMVRLDETAEKFAGTIGKSAGELTTFEKRMAFTNAIIEQGERKFGNLNEAIEANPYSKLAATFDSLLKSTIAFVEKGLGPIVSLLASNVGLLTGAIGIFAAGVVKMMVPALTQGGKAASEMAARTRDMAKEQLQSVKIFKGAPKVFTNLQKKMAAGTATEKDMVKAKASLNQSIAKHQKLQKGDSVRYAKSTAEGKQKIAIINSEKAALAELLRIEQLEAKATLMSGRADVMHTASTGGLVATYKALTAQIAAEHAVLTAETAGTNLATRAKQRLALAAGQAGLAVRAFGTAVVNAIPMIGMIVFAISLAVAGFKKFFIAPPTALEEQLKETKKAMDDFPNIINQMVDAYSHAANASERFEVSLKAQVGLISTVADQLRKQLAVQKVQIITERANAKAALMKAKIKQQEDLKSGAAKKMTFTGSGQNMRAISQGQMNEASILRLQEALAKTNETTIDVAATTDSFRGTLIDAIAHQEIYAMTQIKGSDEQIIANKTLETYRGILEKLSPENVQTTKTLEDMIVSFTKLKASVGNVKDALDSAGEAQLELNKHFTKMKMPQGQFSFFETQLKAINDKLKNSGNLLSVFKEYEATFKNFGLEKDLKLAESFDDPKKLKELGLSPEQGKKIKDSLVANLGIELQNVEARFAAASNAARNFNALVNAQDKNFSRLSEGGPNMSAFEGRSTDLEKRKNEADLVVSAALDTKDPAQIEAANRQAMGVTEEQIKNETDQARFTATSGMSRAGGGTDAGDLGGIMNTVGAGKNNPGTGVFAADSDAKTSEKFAALSESMSPMMENIAALGPDGPLISAAIEGTMVMGEAFTNMFETLETSSLSSAEGMAAGLQAAGAALNAIGNIQAQAAKRQIGKIDDQIAAEKKRDGQSKKSLEKIKQLEKKKEALKKKEFERDKKMKMAQVVISTATSIAMAAAQTGVLAPFFVPMMVALGAAQIAAIASSSYEGGGSAASAGAAKPSSVSAGERSNTVDLAQSKSATGELGYARGESGTGNINNFKPAFTGARYRAAGGSAGYMVGEQGPELFMPDTPGTIVPAGDAATAGGAGANVNFNISALDSAGVEDILVGQRANIISMIRESANQVGDTFLENVDTVGDGATI